MPHLVKVARTKPPRGDFLRPRPPTRPSLFSQPPTKPREIKQMPAPARTFQLPTPSVVYLTVKQFAETQPALTQASIRWDLFHRKTNGLAESGAIVARGNRLLIDPEKYLNWISQQSA